MRDFRRLPPHLRGADGIERVFLAAGSVLTTLSAAVIQLSSRHSSVDLSPVGIIAVNLGLLCLVCAFAVRLYITLFRQPDRRPLTLNSLQSLIGVIALATALPICAIVLALIISPASDAFQIVFPISIMGAVVLLVAYLSTYSRRQAAG